MRTGDERMEQSESGRRLSLSRLVALPWLFCGVAALAMVALPSPAGFLDAGYAGLGAVCLIVGTWMLIAGARLSLRTHELVSATGVVLTGLSIVFGGAELFSTSPNEAIYLWLMLFAAYFFPSRAVIGLLVLFAASYAAAIAALDPGGNAVLRAAIVTIGIVGATLIVSQLRARVDYARSLSQATLESTADGLLVVDTDGRWRGFNRNFMEMWRIPDEFGKRGADAAALEYVLDQLTDPAAFIAKVRELYDHPEEESFDEVSFKDGRVFERYSKPQRVEGRVVGRVWSFRDVTDRRRADAQLQHLADHDSLTDLVNRRRFEEALTVELERSARYGSGGALLLLDLDDFKRVNDTHGHLRGDEVLRATARLLGSRLRSTDLLGRLGGDEFAVLLPEADTVRATKLAEELLEVIREHEFDTREGPLRMTTSIGVVALADLPEGDMEPMAAADTAMYTAKREGRDRLAAFRAAVGAASAAEPSRRNP